jgi:hypothetical protein
MEVNDTYILTTKSQAQCLTSIIPTIWEAEIEGLKFVASLGKKQKKKKKERKKN